MIEDNEGTFKKELNPVIKLIVSWLDLIRGGYIMIKTYIIEEGQKPTPEQIMEIREAAKKPVEFDEDCPELSPAMMKAFKSSIANRNRRRKAL